MSNLTILYLTANRVPEKWHSYQMDVLLTASNGCEIITISREPMKFGDKNIIQDGGLGVNNIYRQILRGAKLATTPFIAIAEDDCLYASDHFFAFTPQIDEIAYNQYRWNLYTWAKPIYSMEKKQSYINAFMVGGRLAVIKSLEERFDKYPLVPVEHCNEIGKSEKYLGLTPAKTLPFWSYNGVIQIDHDYFTNENTGKEAIEHRHKKQMKRIQAYTIPYWESPDKYLKLFV